MFGSKLKTWMENYIGRTKKKEVQKEKVRGNEKGGVILESSESLVHTDNGISSSSQQVFSSSANDKREKYSTTTIESDRSGMIHTNTTISLPSPESAYSTGYSTDGASPEATGPPEYYINIRTGKHYFPSPAPTPTSTQPENPLMQFHSENQHLTSPLFSEDSSLPLRLAHYSQEREFSSSFSSSSSAKSRFHASFKNSNSFLQEVDRFVPKIQGSVTGQNTLISTQSGHSVILKSLNKKFPSKTQLSSLKHFLKSPKNETEKPKHDINKIPTPENRKKIISNVKPKKWFKQPFHKFAHRRIDSCNEKRLENDAKRETHFGKNFCYRVCHENSSSPRQRNRIKTNPWLPIEPLSSQNFHNINFSPRLTRNRSCSSTPLQNRKMSQPIFLQDRIMQLNSKFEETRDYLDGLEKAVNHQLKIELSDHSEEDLTLNEMMGTYSESYVYEKETDILSDSDPTDCEDYVTDSEANNGGDERDSHDDELDFIDNGSVIESDEKFSGNIEKCAYYDTRIKKNFFLFKLDRRHSRKGSECRKNLKKDPDLKSRKEKRRHPRKPFKRGDEDIKMGLDRKMKQKFEFDENIGKMNLNKILAQRMMVQKLSKYSKETPEMEKRQNFEKEFRTFRNGNMTAGTETNEIKSDVLVNLILDAEADIRYKELIKEAENIFESIHNSPRNNNVKRKHLLNSEDRDFDKVAFDALTNTETSGHFLAKPKEQDMYVKKCPKELGLKLFVETPKKPGRLDFGAKGQSSLRAKTSAHSPLDPLGPNLRKFAIFPSTCDEKKVSTNFSTDSKNGKAKGQGRKCEFVGVPPVVPIAFHSLDLGKPLAPYCPQSEPVKRKIYTCSKTYDKLVKQLEF